MTAAAIKRLRQLARSEPTLLHVLALIQQVGHESNDRGTVLILFALVESSLDTAIDASLRGAARPLFDQGGPLDTFHSKIEIGMALGLYGELTRQALRCIKDIRNVFAHTIIPITFKTTEVRLACYLVPHLDYITCAPPFKKEHFDYPMTAQKHFLEACVRVSGNLFNLHKGVLEEEARLNTNNQALTTFPLCVKPKPLP